MIGTVVSIGIVSGPFLGGLLIEAASWRWIFLVNLPVGIIGTLTAWRFVPKTPGSPTASIDVAGAATLCIALLSFSLALTLGQDAGFGAPPILGLFAGAALALAAFIRVELRTPEPMIQLRLLANPSLASSIASGYLGFIAIGGYFLILPFYLEASLGLDPAATGRLLAIGPIALGVVAPLSGRLSDRIGVRPLTISGLVFLTIAYAAGSRLGVDTTVAQFLTLTIPVGIGMGVFQSPNNSAVMGAVGRLHAGFGGGLLALTRILGQLTGIAVLGSVWAWRIAARGGGSIGEASPGAVAGATSDTLLLMGAMMAVATLIAVWGVAKERSPSVSVTPG
jgi:MFS family permease